MENPAASGQLWRRFIFALGAATSLVLAGCSTSQTNVALVAPAELPDKTRTPYSDAASCFGDMLTDYRSSQYGESLPLRLAIINVADATNVSTVEYPNSEIPNNFTDIALGAASRIGGPIRVVHVPREGEIIDAARFSSVSTQDPFLSGFEPTHYRADTIQIYGALTAYDRFIKGRERDLDGSFIVGGGTGETNIELSRERIINQARMTMDFRAAHVYVGDIVNHSSSTNSLTLYQRSVDNSFGISVDGNSIGYALSNTMIDARHYAIRILVERGLIETIGKYLGVPYWRCFPETNLHTAVAFDDVVKIGDIKKFVLQEPVLAEGVVSGNLRSRQNTDEQAPDAEKDNREQPVSDPRDHELIWSVASDFLFAEYLENNSRKRQPRPDNTTEIKLSTPPRASDLRRYREGEQERIEAMGKAVGAEPNPYPGRQITVKGRHDKLSALVRYYQQQITSYQRMSEKAVLDDVTRRFIEYGVLNNRTARSPMHVYLALWLNLPIRSGARWLH